MRMNRMGRVSALLLAALFLLGSPASAQLSQRDRQQSASQHEQIIAAYGGVYDHPEIGPYVARVTTRIAGASSMPNESFRVTVLNSPVVNAFALPGGYVYVTRGLVALANSEAELASVIGHEIAHVTQKHGQGRQDRAIGATLLGAILGVAVGSDIVNQIFNIGASGFLADYSRDQEEEADRVGLDMLARAGYDPYAASSFLASLGAQSALHAQLQGSQYDPNRVDWLASHPATGQRVNATRLQAQQTGLAPGTRAVGADAHYAAIDGMIYGDDPEQGFVRGRKFIHPKMRFQFEVPEGFQMANGSTAVIAQDTSGAQIKFDGAPRGSAPNMAAYITQVWARDARISQIEAIEVNGIATATGVTRVKGKDVRLVAYDAGDQKGVFRFLISTPSQQTARLASPMRDMVVSFRRLTASQAEQVSALRLDVRTVTRRDSVASLAAKSAFEDAVEQRFRVLNGLSEGDALVSGQKIKLVVD